MMAVLVRMCTSKHGEDVREHEEIVHGNNVNVIDTLCLEFGELLDKARNLVRASTAERSGHADDEALDDMR
jgi:hypothetical protein